MSTKLKSTGTIPPTRRPSALKTKQILDTVKARETIALKAASMSTEDIDSMYSSVSNRLKCELDAKKVEVDRMQDRSEQIDTVLSEIRVRNKEELVKTERRLSRLHLEAKALEAGETLFGDQEESHKDSPLQSRRQSALSQQILNIQSNSKSCLGALETIIGDDDEFEDDRFCKLIECMYDWFLFNLLV